MVLFLNNGVIYAKNKEMKKEEIIEIADAVWYDGDFSFFDGENKEGFYKVFKWNGMKPVIEYQPIPEEPEQEKTQLDRIEEQIGKFQDEIRQEGADMVMEEMKKRGLIV